MHWEPSPQSPAEIRSKRGGSRDFSMTRESLLAFYPEDVRRKKIAARAAIMSQAGQYNLLRLIKRQDKWRQAAGP